MMTDVGDQYLSFPMAMMRKSGLWPSSWKEILMGRVVVLGMASCALMIIPSIDPTKGDEFKFLLASVINSFTVMFKFLVLKLYQSRGEWMINDTNERCCRLAAEFPEYKNLLDNRARRITKITKGLVAVMAIVFGSWMVIPFFNAIGIFKASGANLPLKMWYPMDLSKRLNLTVAVLHQIFLTAVSILPYIMANMIYIAFISLTCGQLQIISLGMKSLNRHNVHKKLRFCSETHSSILTFGKELEFLMSPILLVIFVAYVAMICQCLIQLSSGPIGSEQSLKFLLYLCLLLVEVWLYCYFGNQLIEYVLKLCYSTYTLLRELNE